MAKKGGDFSAKARAAGKHWGRPKTPRPQIPQHDRALAERALRKNEEETKVVEYLEYTWKNDKKSWWAARCRLADEARGKPVQPLSGADGKSSLATVNVNIRRIGS